MINKELHEAFGYCWHERRGNPAVMWNENAPISICTCGKVDCEESNPDYKADPRLVIREMEKREDYRLFMAKIQYGFQSKIVEAIDWDESIDIDLIMDITGKLAQLALDWINKTGD